MTKSEVAKLIYTIGAVYPRYFDQAPDIERMVDAWLFVLGGYSYKDVSVGLKVYLDNDESGFPPSPGQIIGMIRRAKDHPAKEMTAAEAWQLVWDAVTSLRWESPEVEFNKLPFECRRAIGSAESLREIAMMETENVLIGEKARFMRQYDAIKEREKDFLRLPEEIRHMTEVSGKDAKQLVGDGCERGFE